MVLIKTKDGWNVRHGLPGDSECFSFQRRHIATQKQERVKKIWPTFPPIEPHYIDNYMYCLASITHLELIVSLVDRLLSGKDFFCPRGQHLSYYKYKTILLCFDKTRLIGWAVRQKNGALIHLLVEPDYRGKGIGGHMLEVLQPLIIRSKSDQSTGNPRAFYEKHGYTESPDERVGKNKNIDLLTKPIKTTP